MKIFSLSLSISLSLSLSLSLLQDVVESDVPPYEVCGSHGTCDHSSGECICELGTLPPSGTETHILWAFSFLFTLLFLQLL